MIGIVMRAFQGLQRTMWNPGNDDDDGVLALPPSLDLSMAEPLQRTLLERCRAGDPLIIAGAAVERVSTAVVQILLAAVAEARSHGVSFQLREPSSALTAAFTDLGVASHFAVQVL